MTQPTTHLGHVVQSTALGLQTCTARYCTKQLVIKRSTGENDAVQRHSKHQVCEAVAGITRHALS